ncbi:hypothetical protein D3C71_1683380 [compost metagenome]
MLGVEPLCTTTPALLVMVKLAPLGVLDTFTGYLLSPTMLAQPEVRSAVVRAETVSSLRRASMVDPCERSLPSLAEACFMSPRNVMGGGFSSAANLITSGVVISLRI